MRAVMFGKGFKLKSYDEQKEIIEQAEAARQKEYDKWMRNRKKREERRMKEAEQNIPKREKEIENLTNRIQELRNEGGDKTLIRQLTSKLHVQKRTLGRELQQREAKPRDEPNNKNARSSSSRTKKEKVQTVTKQAHVQYAVSTQETPGEVERQHHDSDNGSEIKAGDNKSSSILGHDDDRDTLAYRNSIYDENINLLDEDTIYEREEEEETTTTLWLLHTLKKYLTCQF